MPLNLTIAEFLDRSYTKAKSSPAKTVANRRAALLLLIVLALLFAATFGLIFPCPIHAYFPGL